MDEERPLNVVVWLSDLSSSPNASTDSTTQDAPSETYSPTQDTPSKTSQKQKRKRIPETHSDPTHHHTESRQPLTHTALTELSLNIMNTPSPSVQERGAKKLKVGEHIFTPQTDPSKHSYQAASRPPTTTPGGSSNSKQTPNEFNVRMASARQAMFFEDDDSYEKYPEFKAYIENMVFGSRGSAMRTESIQSIKTWKAKNATKDEKTYFAGIIPKVFKEVRNVSVPKKRSFEGEIVHQAQSFKTDGLDQREDCLFVKGLLPLRQTTAEATSQGITTAKPDVVYGLEVPQHPDLDEPVLKGETMAEIQVAPGIKHAFFSVDNKGSQSSIEAAENQAMRAGATMVSARRYLNRKAKGKVVPLVLGNEVTGTDAVTADTGPADDTAMSDPFVASVGAEANIPVTGPLASGTQEEDLGVDTSSFAFTCSWVPQMANLHVHWCERRPRGGQVYHMNLLRGYLMSDKDHLSHFRKDVHNILDYGVSTKRKETLNQLERDIAKYEGESR